MSYKVHFVALFLAVWLSPSAHALVRVWSGNATMDNHWTVSGNWQNGAPVAGNDLEFPQGASHPNSSDDYSNGTTFNSIFFWNSGGSGMQNGFTLGGNSIALNAGVIASNLASLTWVNTVNNALLLNSNQTLTAGPFTSLLFQGPINLNANNLAADIASSSAIDVHAVISGAGGLTKTNGGVLTLWSNNTYTGSTILNGGTLQIYGTQPASPVALVAGTFYGQGTVGTLTALGSGGPGTVLFRPALTRFSMTSSNLTLNSAATFQVVLNGLISGGNYSTLLVHGTVALNDATLAVSLGFTPAIGDSFLIISNDGADPVGGTFNGLPEGALFLLGGSYFRITYAGGDGNDVVLSRVSRVLTVTTTADSGDGSLRDTLAAAIDTDTINFAPNVVGSISLTSAELLVNKSVNILGPGPGLLALNGNAARRAFHITNAVTAVISGLAITNGGAVGIAGGVYNDHSTLTISNCLISGNQQPGIHNSSGVLTLNGCTLTRNSGSGNGGAIVNDGYAGSAALAVTNCTFSTNLAIAGSGIMNSCDAGGTATLKVFACTFVANNGSGILNSGGSTGNPVLEIGDTILQALSPSVTLVNNAGTVISDGYNLSSDSALGLLTNATDLHNIDARLGPLVNNGGPTPTHALLWGSPAIDQGKAFGAVADQRGMPRPNDFSSVTNASNGDGCDIGAFEFKSPPAQFISIGALTNALQLQGTGLSNLTYTIQSATNLIPSIAWSNLGSATANASGVFSFTDTNAPRLPMRFYRALSP